MTRLGDRLKSPVALNCLDVPRRPIGQKYKASSKRPRHFSGRARVFGVSAFGTDLGLRIMEGLGLVAVT
jgi:hypothetical protein